jgi:thiol:disulfide interchange protein DsbA
MFAKRMLLTLGALLVSALAWAFDEGIDYTTLAAAQPTETGDKIEVVEVFMYSCPHCFHLEPRLEKWLAAKPANVELRKMPAVFGPKVEPHARAFYAAQLLGVEGEFGNALFRALHVQNRKIWDEDALVDFAAEQGIDAEGFRQAYRSFAVSMKVRRAEEMGRRYGVDGVPAMIVNGKYRTSPSQVGSQEKMFEVVDELIRMETAEAAASQVEPVRGGS